MIKIEGIYNTAFVYTDALDASAEGQIKALCGQKFCEGSKIRIMPDVHAGNGCTIGTTMTVKEQTVPNLVGVDIGCGMETVRLKDKRINLPALDAFIRQNIPCGRNVRERPHRNSASAGLDALYCLKSLDARKTDESLGTLGGGNHFIEIDKDDDGSLYLVIHTGSRSVGLKVAEYYQKKAYDSVGGKAQTDIPYELAPLGGRLLEEYLHDMALTQKFAALNRQTIKEVILGGMKLREDGSFSTVHNYIDTGNMILRKGAVPAAKGETLLIPMNMRDGSLICTGLGNDEWNCSAPHGAGRKYSRAETENVFTVSAFRKEMSGIYTTSVSKDTLDECPMAYKPMEEITGAIGDTVRIERLIRPVYNFKASESFSGKVR